MNKVENTQNEKMDQKIDELKKKNQIAKPEHKRTKVMHRNDTEIKENTKAQETVVVASATTMTFSGHGN